MHLALTHGNNAIVYSGDDLLDVIQNAPGDCYIVSESLLIATGRVAEIVTGVNWYAGVYWEHPGQRVDLAIQCRSSARQE